MHVLKNESALLVLKPTTMQKKVKFTLVTLWILFSRSYDAYCTAQLTPDLSKEANPLVTVGGLGWTPLLLIIGALVLYTIYAYYLSVFRKRNLLPAEKGFTFSEVVAYMYLGEKRSWTAMFYSFPKSLSRFNHYMGHTLTPCVVYAGVVSTLMWLLINYVPAYRPLHSAPFIYTVLIAGCGVLMLLWNRNMYAVYKQPVADER